MSKNPFENCKTKGEIALTIVIVILVLALAFGLICFEAWIAMLLWNWFFVSFLGLTALYLPNIWYAFGIMLLCNILFKSHNYSGNKKDE